MARRPRGASRKRQQRQSPRALRWLGVVALLAVSSLAVKSAIDWLLDPQSFPVKSVRVEGVLQHVQREELRQVIEPQVRNGLVRVSLADVQDSLEAMPWVRYASVRRAWPDKLEVDIEEQVAMARWSEGGLLNSEGTLFLAEAEGALARLPLLQGPAQSQLLMTENFREMQRLLEPVGLRITELSMSERRAWLLALDNGLKLELGRQDTYPRLLRFVRVYPKVLAGRSKTIERIDLRYTNGFAVRWRAGAEAATA